MYDPGLAEKAHNLALLSLSNDEIAQALGIAPTTLDVWMAKYQDFKCAIVSGREEADAEVVASLRLRAKGFTRKREVVTRDGGIATVEEYYPPDTQAQRFWLMNRQRKYWAERTTNTHENPDGTALAGMVIQVAAEDLPRLKNAKVSEKDE